MVVTLTEDDTGMRVLYEPVGVLEEDAIDIVAIHGIGAHPDHTWTKIIKSESEEPHYVDWLKDKHMLPSVAPNARILRYGYESKWFGEDAVRRKVTTVARRFLEALKIDREDHPCRPLIIISHCFGGLVVLKALVEARDHREDSPGIYDSVAGLVFFGTPFRGSEGIKLSEMIEAAQREYDEDQIHPQILQILEPGNEFLDDLVDQFTRTRSGLTASPVFCFYETKLSNVGGIVGSRPRIRLVVNEGSGCLDRSNSIGKYPLDRTHFEMNKFVKPDGEDFRMVSKVIKDMVKHASPLLLSRAQVTTSTLHAKPTGNVYWSVPRSVNTLFTGRTELLERIKNAIAYHGYSPLEEQKIYVITGLGGQGKSEISLKVANNMREQFWAVFWVDVGSPSIADNNFINVAKLLESSEKSMESAIQMLSNTRKPWLLILDNADDPNFDYQVYLPSGTHGSVIMTSRVSECSHYNTVGFEQLNGLDVEDSTELLLKAARKPRQSWHSYQQQAKDIVELLGPHTLALIQAGAYIAAHHCELDKYHEEYKKQRKRLLKFRPKQAKSRYQDVYATFEASAGVLTDDALELLEVISMLHWGLLLLEIFHSAWNGSKIHQVDDDEDSEIGPCDLSQWHVLQLPAFISTKDKDWDPFRLNEAVSLLASLSLITQDASFGISMHPLTHAWAKDRQESIDQAWIKTGSVIALSCRGSDIWRADERFLKLHVQSYIIPEVYTVLYKYELKVLPFLVECAFILSDSGYYNRSAILIQNLFRIIGIDPDHPSNDFLRIYELSALCYAALGNPQEGIEQLESVLEIAVSTLRKDDHNIPSLQHSLALAYLKNKQFEKAIELFEIVLNFDSTLPEDNSDRLTSKLGLAKAYLENKEVGRAINLFKHVVKIREADLPESHPDRRISQYQLACGYLANNQVDEAIELLEHVLIIEKLILADDIRGRSRVSLRKVWPNRQGYSTIRARP